MQASDIAVPSDPRLFRSPWVARLRTLARHFDFSAAADSPEPQPRLPRLVRRFRYFLLFVGLPTLIATIYFFCFAADQYESEAHFYVVGGSSGSSSSSSGSSSGGSSAGALLNGSGASAKAEEETLAVLDFMDSHDAVSDLEKKLDLSEIYRRPEADFLMRLSKDATAEETYRYLFKYAPKIDVYLDFMSGVGVLRVRAFRAEDAKKVTDVLLDAGERMMDQLSVRIRDQILRLAREEVSAAEARVSAISAKITDFRLKQSSMDPEKSTDTVFSVIGTLEGNLAQAQSNLKAAQAYLKPDSPSYIQMKNQVAALDSEIDAQKRRLTGTDGSLAPTVAVYDQLLLDKQFAQQDYTSALSALESARLYAERQQFFLERVVDANLPEEADYPRRFMLVAIVFFGTFFFYMLIGLIFAGIRDHVA